MISRNNYFFYLGAIFSQIFTLGTSYFILWKLSPVIYGEFSFITSVIAIIASVSTFKFEQSIAISNSSEDVNNKFFLTTGLGLGVYLLLSILSLPFISGFNLFGFLLSFLLAFGIILNASLQQFFLYYERHKFNALLSFFVPFLNFIFTYLLLTVNDGLIIAYSVSYFIVTAFFLIYCFIKRDLHFITFQVFKRTFSENINYPKFILPASIATIALTYFSPVFLKMIYSTKEVGLFAISNRFLLLPSIVVGAVVSGLFRAKISKSYFEGNFNEIKSIYINLLKFMFIVGVVCFPILVIVLWNLEKFIKITNWEELGVYSLWLVGYGISQFWIAPILNIPLVLNKHRMLLVINLVQLALLVLIYFFTWFTGIGILQFLFIMSIAFLVFSTILTIMSFKLIKK